MEEQYRTDAFGSVNETVLDAYFSRDGKHLVVHTSKSPAPEVIPIGRQDIFGHLLGDNEPIATLSDTSNITAMQSASRSTMIVPTNRVPQILKSETDITGTNEASGTSIVYTGREVTIRKWSNQDSASAQGGKEEVLKLLRLPAWSGLSSSSVAIRAPRPDEEKLRVVMNKSARDWEDMVQEVDVNLPAIISRDMRNLTVESSDTSTGLIEDGQKRT